jgi:hypothetical protein
MRHVDQPTLDSIINGKLSPRELARLKEHVRVCPLCARRLDEFRDVFSEVEAIIPTAERGVVDDEETRGWRRILLPKGLDALPRSDRIIWAVVGAAAVATAIVAAVLLRSPTLPPPPVTPAPAARPPAAAEATTPAPTPPAGSPSPPIPQPTTATPKAVAPAPAAPPAAGAPTPRPATAAAASSGPGFHRVESAQAIRALGGTVRLIDGLIPDHFEMAVGTGVPGAVDSLPVVRVVYRAGGSPLLLDEQRRGGMTPGDTLVGTAQVGVSVLQWNSAGFWLSLAGRMPVDSLEMLARRIR